MKHAGFPKILVNDLWSIRGAVGGKQHYREAIPLAGGWIFEVKRRLKLHSRVSGEPLSLSINSAIIPAGNPRVGELIQNGKPLPERICLRAPPWQVLAMIPCFAAILGGHLFGAYAAFSNLDGSFPHPVAFGLYISAQGFFFLLVGVYYFIAVGRERIWIFDDAIVQRGSFFTRRIEFKDILALNWRQHTFRLVIEGPDTRIAIWLNTYPIAQQQQVIEFFRSAVPKHLHKNYRPFRSRYTEFLKHHVTLPRPAPRFRWLALVDAFLYLLVPGLCIVAFFRISQELPGGLLFTSPDVDDGRQKLMQAAAIFVGICVVCVVFAAYYVYRYFTFRETPVVTK